MIVAWPSGYDIERYRNDYGLDEADLTRDIVRIATIAHLVGAGTLHDDFVLGGGMALRLRGSNRFTIKDTDTSLRGRLDEVEIHSRLSNVNSEDLQLVPDPGERWGRKTPKLVDIRPIAYDAYFASVTGDPVKGEFSFTVNTRGLFREATWLRLVYPYPEIGLGGARSDRASDEHRRACS